MQKEPRMEIDFGIKHNTIELICQKCQYQEQFQRKTRRGVNKDINILKKEY
jgi:predicted nucleic-acid-binding Zn-ribbon protein